MEPIAAGAQVGGSPVDDARAVLDEAIRQSILLGSQLEWRDEYGAVLSYDRHVSHVLHAILTLLTGFWALIWIVVYLRRRVRFSLRVLPRGSAGEARVEKVYIAGRSGRQIVDVR